jgi:hypothetical protein
LGLFLFLVKDEMLNFKLWNYLKDEISQCSIYCGCIEEIYHILCFFSLTCCKVCLDFSQKYTQVGRFKQWQNEQLKLKFQSEQWNAVEQKNSVVLAVYGIIMAVFLAGDAESAFTTYQTPIIGMHAQVRRKIAAILGKLRVKKAVRPLIQALDDEDVYVRLESVKALAEFKDKRAVPGLAKRLTDDISDVRRAAKKALTIITAAEGQI